MSVWLAILVAHSLLLALLLAVHGRRRDPANGLLAAFVAVTGVLLFESWLGCSGSWNHLPRLLGIFRPIWFAVGPLALLYIRRSSGVEASRRELLLTVPAIVVFVSLLPSYLGVGDRGLAQFLLSTAAGTLTLFFGFSALTGGCAWAAARQLAATQSEETLVEEEGPWRVAWQRLLMQLLAAYALLDLVATAWFLARGGYPALLGFASLMVLVSLVYAIGYLVVLPDGLLARAAEAAQLGPAASRSELSPGRARILIDRLDRLMSEEELWREEELRLEEVAGRLGISRHHLSGLFNQHLGTTFRNYLNTRRVAEVQRALVANQRSGSLLDLAFDSGFGSSASFYRAFRKHVGCTPKQFIANGNLSPPAVVIRDEAAQDRDGLTPVRGVQAGPMS